MLYQTIRVLPAFTVPLSVFFTDKNWRNFSLVKNTNKGRVATPPNAIVFSSGHMQVKHMMKAGIWLNIISITLIYFASVTLMEWVYGS